MNQPFDFSAITNIEEVVLVFYNPETNRIRLVYPLEANRPAASYPEKVDRAQLEQFLGDLGDAAGARFMTEPASRSRDHEIYRRE